MQRLQIVEVLARALIDCRVELQMNLIDAGREQDLQAGAVDSMLRPLIEAVGQSEVEQRRGSWVQPVIGQPEVAGYGMCGIEQGRGERLRRYEPPILDDCEDVDILRSAGHESESQQRRTADDGKRVALAVRCELIGEGVEETIGGPGTINRGVSHLNSRCYISRSSQLAYAGGHFIPRACVESAAAALWALAAPLLEEEGDILVQAAVAKLGHPGGADEAHRSQYASFEENITIALPNATRIGFTGTPVESADRSTRRVFGDYVSIYRMRQAQEDHATVPIYYESRQIPLDVDQEQLAEVEEVLEDEEQDAASKLVTAWAKLEKVVGAPERLERLADDVHEHFSARCEVLDGKAMVVAYSRRIAAELTGLLQERLGEEAVTCVISAQATDLPVVSRFRRSKPELRQLARDFRDEHHPLRIVVVKDMWLTGFDAPVLNTLYIDKPMRDHGLLQAIARVNRVFRDKPGGLVVDYIGIGEDLRASLRAYDDTELDDPVIPAAKAVAGLWERYEVLCAMLYPVGYRQGELHLVADPSRLFLDAYKPPSRRRGEHARVSRRAGGFGEVVCARPYPTGGDRAARGDRLLQ